MQKNQSFLLPAAGLLISFFSLMSLPADAQYTVPLPDHSGSASSSILWWITQSGLGSAGQFEITNSSNSSPALLGITNGSGRGIFGSTQSGDAGVFGFGTSTGVTGLTSSPGGAGVYGENRGGGTGVSGYSATGNGVTGKSGSASQAGVYGSNTAGGIGISGFSRTGYGVSGSTATGYGGYFGASSSLGTALFVNGTAVAKVVQITGGSDVAEPYTVTAPENKRPIAGMVVCIDGNHTGQMRLSDHAYDHTVAGIISGANGIQPGITIRQKGTPADGALPIASMGRVWCWCDANAGGSISPGDLLTTSNTLGHAMKARMQDQARGAILGKAMSPLKIGRGLVLVLVSLE